MLRKIKDYIKNRKRKKQLESIRDNFRKHQADKMDLNPEINEIVNKNFWDLL